MDITAIIVAAISGAAFLASIIGPYIAAKTTCNHEERMYRARFKTEHEHEVIERYLKAVGRLAFASDHNEMKDFGEASAEIFMYAPQELWSDIRDLNEQISDLCHAENYHQKKEQRIIIQVSYFALCEKFSNLRRESQEQNPRSHKKQC